MTQERTHAELWDAIWGDRRDDHSQRAENARASEREQLDADYLRVFGSLNGRRVLADLERRIANPVFDPLAHDSMDKMAAIGLYKTGAVAVIVHIKERLERARARTEKGKKR